MRKQRKKILYVQWYDIEVETEWSKMKEMEKPYRGAECHSIGFLLRDDANSIRLAMSITEDMHCREIKTIPQGCVVKKVLLGYSDPFRKAKLVRKEK